MLHLTNTTPSHKLKTPGTGIQLRLEEFAEDYQWKLLMLDGNLYLMNRPNENTHYATAGIFSTVLKDKHLELVKGIGIATDFHVFKENMADRLTRMLASKGYTIEITEHFKGT